MKFKSALITQASGSIGGMTASRNRGGMYFRSRSIPTDTATDRQNVMRAELGGLVQAWNQALDDGQREAWRLYGQQTPATNVFGDQIQLSGQQQFIRSNAARMQAIASPLNTSDYGTARVDNAPTLFNTGSPVDAITLFELDAAGEELSISANFASATDELGLVLVYVGAPQNPGKNYFRGPYQLAALGPVAAAALDVDITGIDLSDPTAWAAEQVPQEGQRIPVLIRVSYDDGRISQRFRQIVTVTQAEE